MTLKEIIKEYNKKIDIIKREIEYELKKKTSLIKLTMIQY